MVPTSSGSSSLIGETLLRLLLVRGLLNLAVRRILLLVDSTAQVVAALGRGLPLLVVLGRRSLLARLVLVGPRAARMVDSILASAAAASVSPVSVAVRNTVSAFIVRKSWRSWAIAVIPGFFSTEMKRMASIMVVTID